MREVRTSQSKVLQDILIGQIEHIQIHFDSTHAPDDKVEVDRI